MNRAIVQAAGELASRTRERLGREVNEIGRVLTIAGVPVALGCFFRAMQLVNPDGFERLAARSLDVSLVHVPLEVANVAIWPLHYIYLITFPAKDLTDHRLEAVAYAAAGGVLVALVNWFMLVRQTLENRAFKAAVALWFLAMALTAFDFFRCCMLPVTWDNAPLLGTVSNGMALRAAEVVVSVHLWSLHLVTMSSRVDIGFTRSWAQVSHYVRQELTKRGAIVVMLLPYIKAAISLLERNANSPQHGFYVVVAVIIGGVVVLLVIAPLLLWLRVLVRFAVSTISNGRLLVPRFELPEGPER